MIRGWTATTKRFRVASHHAALSKPASKRRTPAGTTLRLAALSERSTLVIDVSRTHAHRSQIVGTLVRPAAGPGGTSVAFDGTVGGAALPPGHYVITAIAVDAAGNRSAPAALAVTVVA